MEKASFGYNPAIRIDGGPIRTITFNDKLTDEELEIARLVARVNFWDLLFTANIMNEKNISFKEAYKLYLQQNKE